MATIAQIREQYPQYSDMSDAALASALYQKFYSDIPRAEFDAKVGLKAAPVKAVPTTEEPTPAVDQPMGEGFGSAIMGVAAPPVGGSIFDRGVKMEPPTVDAQKNLEAMQRSRSPESVMFTPGRGLLRANKIIEQSQARQAQFRAINERMRQFDAEKLQREKEEQGYYGPLDLVQDVGLAATKGVVGLGQMGIGLANILTGWVPDNPLGVGQWGKMMDKLGYNPEQTNKFFTGLQTPIARTQQEEVEAAQGFLDTLKALAVNPVALTTSIVESLPGTVASGAAGGKLTKMLIMQATKEAAEKGLTGYAAQRFISTKVKDQVPKIAAAASAAEGVQTAGSIAEQAREAGRDWGQYVAPAVAAGLGTAAIGMVSGKVARKFGIGDIETEIAARTAGIKGVGIGKDPFAKSLFKEMAKEGLLEELPQSVQEQIFTNLALGNPWDKGVGKAAAQGLVLGAAMGGGHSALATALGRTRDIIQEKMDDRRLQAERGELPMTAEELARSKGFLGGPKKSIEELLANLETESDRLFGEGAPDVRQPITPAGGAGVSVAGQSDQITTPAGIGEPVTDGMVPAGQDVTAAPQGEGVQPGAVDQDIYGRVEPRFEPVEPASVDASNISDPTQTPLHKYVTGINKQLDTFYNDLYSKPYMELPENLQRSRITLDGFNNAIKIVQDGLAKWDHPALRFKTPAQRAAAKSKASLEDSRLLDAVSELAGIGTRIANQAMAISKGYKGKKAGSLEKIEAAEAEGEKLFTEIADLMNARGLLPDDLAADLESLKARDTAEPIAEPPQQVPTPKPAPTTDVSTPVDVTDSTTPKPAEDKPYFGSDEINALGDRIKNAINKITSDFMVGDMVRYGNTNGVVVGADDTHVKIHPDGAKSPKAYYRVPKSSVTMIARPDTTSKTAAMAAPGEDKKFGAEQGKLNADMGGLIQLLGANMYASSIAEVTVKELLQNSFDAVKGAVSNKKAPSLYKSGEITITFNDSERTITVTDNARGMTPEIVRDAFFTVAGSDKSDLAPEERSGGLGLAKMGFMLGAERLILDTVRDGVRVTVDTTAKDIASSKFQIIKKPAPKGEHGTSVTVKIPEYYIDPKTGDKKDIYFSANPTYYTVLEKPLIGPVIVKTFKKGSFTDKEEILPIGLNFPSDKYIPFKVNFSWGSADVYFGKTRIDDAEYNAKHQILSSGVYQFDGKGGYDRKFKLSQSEVIPYDIIVNIKPSVDAKHPDYPFENSRERFKGRLDEDIASLTAYLAQIARGNEAQDLQDNFKNIVSMPRVEIGQDMADTTKKLQKSFDRRGTTERRELPPMPKEVRVEGTKVVAVDTGKTLADRAKKEEKKTKGTFQAEQAAPEMKDFLLQIAQNPNQPIFHNNTNVDLLEVGRQYGSPEQFFAELGTLMVEMKEALADSGFLGYSALKPENLFFGGVSIDKGYGGVHIKVPYKALLVNPFYDFGAKTLFGVREFLWETMTHEIAHIGDMGHGEGHNAHMLKVRQYLADQGLADYFRDSLMDTLTKHESTFTAMREAYGRSTTKNTAKSLKDYEKGSASASDGSATSRDPDSVRPLPAGRGPSGYETIRAAGPVNPTSGIPRTAGSTAPTSVKGLHQDVVDAVNRNDVNGTLRAIARNTSGWYSELAQRLAELNLPTNIIFNNERALIKRVIDDRSAQQQIRLFAYLSREAPALYNQYFKDYDKAENLERVYEGLRKLPGAGVNIGPVNTDLADVRYAFNKSMPGLTAPGFFAPTLDTINIYPDSRFGTNYRVLLHEIVHAATDYMLAKKLPLTPQQAKAVDDLTEMYKFAQTKLPPSEYGFTNISEFVAEAMTNPKFQGKLRGIAYPERKTTLWGRFMQVVSDMFGLNNLAGASISAINDILSAQRPAGISPMPLSFAQGKKRVRGPISKPDTWRTAESVQRSIRDTIAEATTGRQSIGDAIKDLSTALWDANGTTVRFVILPILQLRQLKDLTRTKFPQITGAVNIVEQMVSYRGKKIRVSEDIVKKWSALQSANPRQTGLMNRIMIEATIRARDPDNGVPAGGAADALDKAWNALEPEYKSLYREVREFYADSVREMVRTMKQRALGLPKAERQEMIRKINEQFGPGKLVTPYFPLRRFGNYWYQIGKGDFKEFYTFESAIARNLSFSKRRRQLQSGNKQQQAAAETMRMGNGISELYSQNVATTQVLRDMEKVVDALTATDVAGLKAEIKDSINQLVYLLLPEQSMRKMFINRKAIQGASADMLRVFAKTAVHSAYQQARFKFAEPFLNNINNARSYIDDLEASNAITPEKGAVYRDYVLELENRTKNVLGVEDTSPIARTVGAITNITFYFMLSAPASAILNVVGMTALTMPRIGARYGYAKTNALMLKNLGLYSATLPKRTIAPALQGNFMQVSFPSIVEGANLNPLLKRAASRFVDDGDINISMTNDIFDMSEQPSALYTGKVNTVKKVMSGVFHQAERLNREVALLTTFELAYEKLLGADRKDIRGVIERDPATNQPLKYTSDEAFELAIQEARDIAGLTLGDYTRQMKGRIFTVPSINLISQFKQYAITATYNILRDSYLSVGAPFRKGEIEQFRQQMIKDGLPQTVIDQRLDEAEQYRKEIYREGMKRLAGVLGMSYLFGGYVAMPFFSMLGRLIAMFAPDDDDEFFDWENWFYNYMVETVGGSAGAIFNKMGMEAGKSQEAGKQLGLAIARGPIATVTGTSLADRVSLDMVNLWYREGRYSPDAREALQQEVIANMGPTMGLGLNWADAWQLAGEGQWGRAFEKALPSMFAGGFKAYRLGTEGATTKGGDVLGGLYPEEFTTWELAMQAIGFQPEKLALAQKAAIQAKTYQQKLLDRRNSLLNRLWMDRGTPSYFDTLQKANEFSLKYPELAIDGEAITNSFNARAEAQAQAEALGARLDKKLIPRLAPMLRYGYSEPRQK